MRHALTAKLIGLAVVTSACAGPATTKESERGAATSSATATSRAATPPATTSTAVAAITAAPSAILAPPASASAPRDVDLEEAPRLIGDTGAPLPQTEERPEITSAAFEKRMKLLVQAIAADDPSIAAPAFFPKVAYEAVKDIKNPGADWKSRLMKAFSRDIHAYHEKLGEDAKAATYRGLAVDEKRIKWMDKGKEGNKIGYFRVTRNKLKIGLEGTKERELELTSLISWRGEWFVVHLSGFK